MIPVFHDTINSMLTEPDKNAPITNHDVNNMKPYENSLQLEAANVKTPRELKSGL